MTPAVVATKRKSVDPPKAARRQPQALESAMHHPVATRGSNHPSSKVAVDRPRAPAVKQSSLGSVSKRAVVWDLDDDDDREVSPSSILFSEPKSSSADTVLCEAYIAKASTAIVPLHVQFTLRQALQDSPCVRGCVTLSARVGRDCLDAVSNLDQAFLRAAMQNAEAWFGKNLNPSMVEDFFRPTIDMHRSDDGACKREVVGRFRLLTDSNACVNSAQDADVNPTTSIVAPDGSVLQLHTAYEVRLRLVGLLFRRQQFFAVWQVESLVKSDRPLALLPFADDDSTRTSDDVEGSEDEIPLPPPEVVLELLQERAVKLARDHAEKVASVRESRATIVRMRDIGSRIAELLKNPGAVQSHEIDEVADALDSLSPP